jgi:hypothetical protein
VNRTPVARHGAEESFSALPPARRVDDSGRRSARGPQDSFSALPPARHVDDSAGSRSARGPQDSFSALPPVNRTPAARHGAEESFSALPPARRVDDSGGRRPRGSALPPATRGPEESFSRMPAVRGPQDSYSSLPPARRVADELQTAVDGLPPARLGLASDDGPATSITGMAPVPGGSNGRRRAEDRLPDRRASHRADDLTPEFGRPPQRREPDPDLSSLRLVPALSSMDDSMEMPAVRMPKHGRPEDYGDDYGVPASRPGPEDSYDRMPAVARPTGGRRRARA